MELGVSGKLTKANLIKKEPTIQNLKVKTQKFKKRISR